MDYLPTSDEQEWLLDELTELVSRRGFEPLVAAHIVEVDRRCFPDRWEPNERGVRRLSRRLLSYAGLEALDVEVQLYDNEVEITDRDTFGRPTSWRHQGAAAWFAGIEGRVCLFGADARQLEEPDAIVGVMAHEVAHAYREHHRLVDRDRAREERLTDLTTVYLGFGVLTTNNAYRYRASGGLDGTMAVTSWSHSTTGYLPPQAMAFLLAAVAVARRLEPGEVRRVARLLETNQKAFFKAAVKALDADQLAARFCLPDRSLWPVPAQAIDPHPAAEEDAEEVASQEESGAADDLELAADSAARDFNRGRAVFRVVKTAAGRWGEVGLFAGGVAGVAAAAAAGMAGGSLAGVAAAGAAAGLLAGATAGRRQVRDYCSDRACETRLARDASQCPGCGGDVRGAIAHQDDRLAAEEALADDDGDQGARSNTASTQ